MREENKILLFSGKNKIIAYSAVDIFFIVGSIHSCPIKGKRKVLQVGLNLLLSFLYVGLDLPLLFVVLGLSLLLLKTINTF